MLKRMCMMLPWVVQEQIGDQLPDRPADNHRGYQFERDEDALPDPPVGEKIDR